MWKSLCASIVLLCSCALPSTSWSGTETAPKDTLRTSVVIEVCIIDGICLPDGSGVIVKDDEMGIGILTAEHVAVGVEDRKYRACSLQERDLCVDLDNFILDWDDSLGTDFAFYPVAGIPSGMRPARVSRRPQSIGDMVWQVGAPGGQHGFVSQGTIAWIDSRDDRPIYSVDGYAMPGSSGGGVFDRHGRLVGITVAVGVAPNPLGIPSFQENMTYVLPITNIKML